ncbi:DUF4214 domain-containing protein [Chelatococcus asaccharovorans]|uniref:DUF4214 domain-containing protein n=1 Tax=Chelatococcus asaccharovorans TaxID=28210 RepID=UPI00224C7809|nr:DUF4214 domain-containing protein [Chelatococcus asaccharovorans]CAH1668700.1 hypothetical protein CHELA40_13177 [Chelatococcus asaccharovorans]CAH1679850.1 hypothetical protein CHELA17_62443 [Chelatococcus asaccharovorans]
MATEIHRLYQELLFRSPNIAEEGYWNSVLGSGRSIEAIRQDFSSSSEYTLIHNEILPTLALYQGAFGRAPDAAGFTFWSDIYNGGALSFSAIMDEFAGSAEFKALHPEIGGEVSSGELVTLFYQNLLGRAPDQAGLAYWTQAFENGQLNGPELANAFFASAEFRAAHGENLSAFIADALDGTLIQSHGSITDVPIARFNDGILHLNLPDEYTFGAGNGAYHLYHGDKTLSWSFDDLRYLKGFDVPPETAVEIGSLMLLFPLTLTGGGSVHLGAGVREAALYRGPYLEGVSGVFVEEGMHFTLPGPTVDSIASPSEGNGFIARWISLNNEFDYLSRIDGGTLALTNQGPLGYDDPTALDHDVLGNVTLGAAAEALNVAFVRLAAEYARYLENGGAPIDEFTGKFAPGVDQSVHDILLGKGSVADMASRNFDADVLADLQQLMPDWVEGRPVYSGLESDSATYEATLAYDWERGIARSGQRNLEIDGTIDGAGYDPDTGHLHIGPGHTPDDFSVVRNDYAGIELGLKAHYIGSDEAVVRSVDASGRVQFTVDAGSQVAGVHGAAETRNDLAAWSIDFSILTGLDGHAGRLEDYRFTLQVDVELSPSRSYINLDLTGSNGVTDWLDQAGIVRLADADGDNPQLAQGTINIGSDFILSEINKIAQGFYGAPPYNFTPYTDFDFVLSAYTLDGVLVGTNHITVDVVAPAV